MNTRQTLGVLAQYECRNITHIAADGSWPIVWAKARGCNVWDAEGRKYLDLTAAFGVAAAGHANAAVVRAGQRQLATLPHAMGDVHPHALKAQLARELSRITFEKWQPVHRRTANVRVTGKTIFCNSGFEAVEAALKTAMLATGKPGIIAFKGGYHGLGYGALNATHRDYFRRPFSKQLARFGSWVEFPAASGLGRSTTRDTLRRVEREICILLRGKAIGAILVEPVQVRGGVNIPAPGFLAALRRLCNEHGAVLILDEIYTGFGRTGRWFACEHSGVAPDLICLGKALTGGFPLSACVGRADLMDKAWPSSTGEAIHTSTFLGNPVGCAMALAEIGELRRLRLPERSATSGRILLSALEAICRDLAPYCDPSGMQMLARGTGLLAGVEFRHRSNRDATLFSLQVIQAMLERGYILLPEGEHSNVVSFTPPLTITERQLCSALRDFKSVLRQLLEKA